jgi:hypothetical protein
MPLCACKGEHQSLKGKFTSGPWKDIERSKALQQYPQQIVDIIHTDLADLHSSSLTAHSNFLSDNPLLAQIPGYPRVPTPLEPKQIRNINLHVPAHRKQETPVLHTQIDNIMVSEKAAAERLRKPHKHMDAELDERLEMHPHNANNNSKDNSFPPTLDKCDKCTFGNVIQHKCCECGEGLCEYCWKRCSSCSTENNLVGTCEECESTHIEKDQHVHHTATPTLSVPSQENFSFVQAAEKFLTPELESYLAILKST